MSWKNSNEEEATLQKAVKVMSFPSMGRNLLSCSLSIRTLMYKVKFQTSLSLNDSLVIMKTLIGCIPLHPPCKEGTWLEEDHPPVTTIRHDQFFSIQCYNFIHI